MADVDAARRELEAALGPEGVLSDPLARRLYARDASMVEGGCALVALPTTAEQVQACVRAAAAHGLPIVPRGSGTGLAGGATPIGDSLVVGTARMTGIDMVMADGSIERLGAEGPESAGYDLRGVVVGSEGTLGIVTRVCVRIVPVPPA